MQVDAAKFSSKFLFPYFRSENLRIAKNDCVEIVFFSSVFLQVNYHIKNHFGSIEGLGKSFWQY